MKKLPELSLFFPCLNDAQSLARLISRADQIAKQVAIRYEILVINDGSTDNTSRVLARLQKRYIHLHTITHPKNMGYGAALQSGFSNARYDWVFYTDGDGQYDPSELKKLVERVTPSVDVVNGYKIHRADHWTRTVLGVLYNRVAHVITRLPIRDIDCDFRLIRRLALRDITLHNDSGAICIELISKLHTHGAKFAEVPVHHYPRRFGRSEFFRISHLSTMLHSLTRRRF